MNTKIPMPAEAESSVVHNARRADAMRHVLHIHQVRESMMLAQQPYLRNAALAGFQAAATAAVALPIVLLSPWPHLIGSASLGALVALFGRFAPRASRGRILILCAFWQTFAVVVMSLATWFGASPAMQLLVLAVCSGLFSFVSVSGQFGPPGPLIFVFAAGASMGPVASGSVVVERAIATASVALIAFAVCALTEVLRQLPEDGNSFAVDPRRPAAHRVIAAIRVALGAGVAALSAHALGAVHPAWAAIGAVAVIQGTHLHVSMNRALQRTTGTIIGAVVVWIVLAHDPSVWTIVALLAALQFATEIVIGFNYALGQIFVTPMALLMSQLAAPHASGLGMVPERVLDTLLGAGIGIVLAILCSTLDDRRYLAKHHAARAARES